MKVILISKIAKLGDVGEIVNVKDGFAKNFLIPSKKAIAYTVANYKFFEEQKQHFEAENQKSTIAASKLKSSLEGKDIIIIENASDDGRLYGSVGSAEIANKINGILGSKSVSRSSILLKKPIKEIGVYTVTISFYSEIGIDLRLIVVRSESEIPSLLNGIKKKESKEKSEAVEAEAVAA
jgi:large subunit ribosomal protein L9